MRIATYNVEWFDNLFDDEGVPIADNGWSGRQDVTRGAQWNAVGKVFQALDADAVMIIERRTKAADAIPFPRWKPLPRYLACARARR